MIKSCCLLTSLPELLGELLPDLNIFARVCGTGITHHILVVLRLLSQGQLARREVTCLGHDIADRPGEDFPSLLAFVGVLLEQVGVRLEVGHNVDFALEASPAQVHDHQGQEINHIISSAETMNWVVQEHWSHPLFTEKGSPPELKQMRSVACCTLYKDSKGSILTCLLNKGLTVVDSFYRLSPGGCIRSTVNVNRIQHRASR